MRGEDHDHAIADLGKKVIEAVSFSWIKSRSRLIHNQQARIAEETPGQFRSAAACLRKNR